MAHYEAKLIGSVKGLGEIYQVYAPLDKQMQAFNRVGVSSLASPQDTALIRIAGLSNDFTRTSMVPVGVKGESPILYRESPFMNPAMARVAVEAHRADRYPTLPGDFYEAVRHYAEEDSGLEPEDRRAIVLSSSEDFSLTPEGDETRFIFGRQAKEYFCRFNHKSIPFSNLPTKDASKGDCVVNYLWFDSPDDDSQLYARYRLLYDDGSAFGVRYAVPNAVQNSGYTLTEIGRANSEIIPVVLSEAGLSGIVERVTRPLGKRLLERLRTGKQ